MIYFKHCTTLDEIKSTYRDLAMKSHPDRGGDTETMQAINREYAYACAYILKAANMEKEKVEEEMNLSQRYREVIEKIIHLPGIDIELCGHWIWVSGDTRPVKEALKAAGLQFASKKLSGTTGRTNSGLLAVVTRPWKKSEKSMVLKPSEKVETGHWKIDLPCCTSFCIHLNCSSSEALP